MSPGRVRPQPSTQHTGPHWEPARLSSPSQASRCVYQRPPWGPQPQERVGWCWGAGRNLVLTRLEVPGPSQHTCPLPTTPYP